MGNCISTKRSYKEGDQRHMMPAEEVLLPECIIDEILLRLPIKSLIKFRTVSTQWLTLITSPYFAYLRTQLRTLQYNPAGIFQVRITRPSGCSENNLITTASSAAAVSEGEQLAPSIDLSGEKMDKILAWEDHLLPLGLGIYCIFKNTNGTALMWNPTTRETKVLPSSPYYDSDAVLTFSFGEEDYEDGNFSYKVGRVTLRNHVENKSCLSLEVYCSRTKTWKFIPNLFSDQNLKDTNWPSDSFMWNDGIHWVDHSDTEDIYINTFHYQTMVFKRIRAPPAPEAVGRYDKRNCHVTLYSDKYDDNFLCLVLPWIKYDKKFLDIWFMREYGVEDSWIKAYTVGPVPKVMEVAGLSNELQGIFLWNGSLDRSHTYLFLCDWKSSNIKTYRLFYNTEDRYILTTEREESLISLSE